MTDIDHSMRQQLVDVLCSHIAALESQLAATERWCEELASRIAALEAIPRIVQAPTENRGLPSIPIADAKATTSNRPIDPRWKDVCDDDLLPSTIPTEKDIPY